MGKHEDYYNLISYIEYPYGKDLPIFNTHGKLIIALFEFRAMKEIHSVINAVLQVYNSIEIGLAIVYGKNNKKFVESNYGKWKNIVLVDTGDGNHNAASYSNRLITPELWERFKNWSHVLVYQCDALLLRKIPDVYFEYDYIGAPWPKSYTGEWRLGGNGGFSLRRVSSMIRVCEPYRNKKISEFKCPHCHEDGFFCRQKSFKYIDVSKDWELHREFAVEKIYIDDPVGLHKVSSWIRNPLQWYNIMINIYKKFINKRRNVKLHSEPFISDDYFASKGDIILNTKMSYELIEEKLYEKSQNIIVIDVIVLRHYLKFLLNIESSFVLITLNQTNCNPYEEYPQGNKNLKNDYDKILEKSNLICWYTKNPSIVHPKLKGIPLGSKWRWTRTDFFIEEKTNAYNILMKHCLYAKENFEKKKEKLLYYGSMNLETTAGAPYKAHNNIRKKMRKEMGTRYKFVGNHSFENYFKHMSEYKFVICPPGRGIDTHRCWESLMVGCIPIMIKVDSMNELYEDLPVLLVDNYENINDEFLNKEYENIRKGTYNFDKLYTDYWDKEFDKYDLSL